MRAPRNRAAEERAQTGGQAALSPLERRFGELRTKLALYLETNIDVFRVLASGWETTVFEFSVNPPSSHPVNIPANTPLVLRFYDGDLAAGKGLREYAVMSALARAGYPAPAPYLFEQSERALGAPFLVMERAAGNPLFAPRAFPAAFKTFTLAFAAFVRAQSGLHALKLQPLDTNGAAMAFTPENGGGDRPLIERILAIIAERIERGPLPGLAAILEHLRAGAVALGASGAPSLVHMDYHPRNVMVRGAHVTGVIDWVNADVGDRHLDAAMTSVILATSALEHPRWMRDNAAGNSLRRLFTALYIPLYHMFAPLDLKRFRYCQAVAAALRLSMIGMMRARGPEAVGFRPEAIGEITPAVVHLLTRYAMRKTGTAVEI
ncbi:MAG: phosphotransferase family protein [Candidatus Binataceae bacterium]